MKEILFAFLSLVLSISTVNSEQLRPNIASITADVKIGETVEVTKQKEPVFRNVICNFSVKQGQSYPPSVIMSGVVVENNGGFPREFVPIYFGSKLHLPRLAALTNVRGEFSFRVWLSGKSNDEITHRLQADGNEATLYLGGQFNEKAEMVSGNTHIHSLDEILKKAAEGKEQARP